LYKPTKIKTNIREHLARVESYLSTVPHLAAAYLFGSYAKKQEASMSDVDIAVLLDRALSSEQMDKLELSIWRNLTEIFHTDEVDLFVMNKIPLSMQFEIIYSGEIICNNDNDTRTDYEVLTCAKYWDFKHLEDEYDRQSLKRLKETYLKE